MRANSWSKRPTRGAFALLGGAFSKRAQSIGVRVNDTNSEISTAADKVTANSRNSRPGMPPISSNGINTATNDKLIDSTVKPTSLAPLSEAASGVSPSSIRRAMFSSMTMASSTTKPVAIISAINDRLFKLKLHRYMTTKVPTNDTGTATLGITVARALRKKANTTKITKATETIKVNSASCKEARIFGLRSSITLSLTAGPKVSRSAGSSAWMASVAAIILAAGWRVTISNTAGKPPEKPALRTFSTASVTCATSPKRSTWPASCPVSELLLGLVRRMISGINSAALRSCSLPSTCQC